MTFGNSLIALPPSAETRLFLSVNSLLAQVPVGVNGKEMSRDGVGVCADADPYSALTFHWPGSALSQPLQWNHVLVVWGMVLKDQRILFPSSSGLLKMVLGK